jgi:hypothetical protein
VLWNTERLSSDSRISSDPPSLHHPALQVDVVEVDAPDAVHADQHAEPEEQQERRDPEPGGQLGGQHRGEYEEGGGEQCGLDTHRITRGDRSARR